MKETKVQFSNAEMDLMCDSEIILTKNKVAQKVKTLLEELQNGMIEHNKTCSEIFSEDVFSISPKISRGENYLGLPYQILDYPRLFKQQDIFAIRTMFWWGHFFSSTLHLSGLFKIAYAPKIITSFDLLVKEGYSIGISNNPWLHHFGHDNYREIEMMTKSLFENECDKAEHLKIAKIVSLKDGYPQHRLFENWKQLTTVCFA